MRPGHCFRLCTEEDFQRVLPDTTVPEMQRSDLAGTVLQLKTLVGEFSRWRFCLYVGVQRSVPEVQCSDLVRAVLQMKTLVGGVGVSIVLVCVGEAQ